MTLAEAIEMVRTATIGNDNMTAPKRLFDALELVLEAAERTTLTEVEPKET